jgi:hypothetical protein
MTPRTPKTALTLRGQLPIVTLTPASEAERDAIIKRLVSVTQVACDAQLDQATEVLRDTKTLEKAVESARKLVKAPVIALGKQIDSVADQFLARMTDAHLLLQNRVNAYVAEREREREVQEAARRAEAARIEAEREAAARVIEDRLAADLAKANTERQRASALARAEVKLADVASEAAEGFSQLPAVATTERPEGLSIRTPWQYEVLDVAKLYAARPDLCVLEAAPRAIRNALSGGMRNCPGLRIWQEVKATVAARA